MYNVADDISNPSRSLRTWPADVQKTDYFEDMNGVDVGVLLLFLFFCCIYLFIYLFIIIIIIIDSQNT